MPFRLAAKKLKTAYSLARASGIIGLLSFCVRNRRQIWWKWRAERYVKRFRQQDLLLVENINGYQMIVSPHDTGIGIELIYSRVHEPQVTKLLPYMVNSGDIVLECGANIGYYTLILSRLVEEHGLIIAVEPNPSACDLLRINLRLNKASNVDVHELALGEEKGTVQFYIPSASNLSSITPMKGQKIIEVIDVEIDTIDSLVERLALPRLDLLRMDIEGYEAVAINGSMNSLSRFHPRILLECHKEKMGIEVANELLLKLKVLGYHIQFCILRDEDWPWVKVPARIFGPYSIDAFLASEIWHNDHLFTYTLFLESKHQGG